VKTSKLPHGLQEPNVIHGHCAYRLHKGVLMRGPLDEHGCEPQQLEDWQAITSERGEGLHAAMGHEALRRFIAKEQQPLRVTFGRIVLVGSFIWSVYWTAQVFA
jgi:hypothetical protein